MDSKFFVVACIWGALSVIHGDDSLLCSLGALEAASTGGLHFLIRCKLVGSRIQISEWRLLVAFVAI